MITRDDWLRAVADVAPAAEPANSDALSMRELAQVLGCGREQAAQRMKALIAAGRAVRVMKRIMDSNGRPQTIPAYRLVEPREP